MNREEQIANAEKATVDSIREQRFAKTAELVKIHGGIHFTHLRWRTKHLPKRLKNAGKH